MTKLIALLSAAILVVIDQIIKRWALLELEPVRQIEVIRDFFYLTYVENRGMAFGLLQGKTVFLSVVVAIVLIVLIFLLLTDKLQSKSIMWALALILAGGTGNLIDRVGRGFVVDYLDFSALFNFPVFNFADCCVVVGTALLLFCILMQDRKEKKASVADTPSDEETGTP